MFYVNGQVGTNHPLLKTAKNILIGSRSNLQSVGLIVLLVSKAASYNPREYTLDQHDSGVLYAQRALAEIVEMKRTGHLIHKTMANLQDKQKHGEKFKDLLCGNKIVLLTANNEIKRHYDWENENNLGKLGSNEFLGQGKDEWVLRTMLTSGSLLAKGCQAAMKLSNRGEELEREAYKLGGHLAMIWQLYLDVKDFFTHPNSYSLVGAPVTLAIWEYPTIYGHILEAKLEKKEVEFKPLYYAVMGTRCFEYLRQLLDEELVAVLQCCEKFPVEEARVALQKMAISVHSEAVQYMPDK
ncbi:unnamed protein product [Parnassius apollo]|uniref:(apollo) hypothetical protein n=1 Tax=Parnassius apollo TaxID=110799 RepID=A0A8S3XBT0_PARAO|nr:unnamed protein product [Parnassius apollo]